jgi:hypothetical protein
MFGGKAVMNADLDEAQLQMRQRQLPVPQEFQQYLTSEQVANILQVRHRYRVPSF